MAEEEEGFTVGESSSCPPAEAEEEDADEDEEMILVSTSVLGVLSASCEMS